ncbi:hypothetical protein [Hahella sp. HN01]|uniref:hypothetical protein n=2 Tax=Oceanospirillales TaxID=135619 RepID=UPI001C1EE2EE|nr:hypothetical protein [Hahella sp. HN01]MBU6954526.1 hypothetical protein [Hahella sp. HN01]
MTYSVTVREREIAVRELTVGDIREWLTMMASSNQTNLVDGLLFQEQQMITSEIAFMTTLDVSELNQFTPRELVKVIDKCKEANPLFFQFRAAVIGADVRIQLPGE